MQEIAESKDFLQLSITVLNQKSMETTHDQSPGSSADYTAQLQSRLWIKTYIWGLCNNPAASIEKCLFLVLVCVFAPPWHCVFLFPSRPDFCALSAFDIKLKPLASESVVGQNLSMKTQPGVISPAKSSDKCFPSCTLWLQGGCAFSVAIWMVGRTAHTDQSIQEIIGNPIPKGQSFFQIYFSLLFQRTEGNQFDRTVWCPMVFVRSSFFGNHSFSQSSKSASKEKHRCCKSPSAVCQCQSAHNLKVSSQMQTDDSIFGHSAS